MKFIESVLSPEGRVFLSDRGLSPKIAEEMGVQCRDGRIYFPYVNGKIVRYKWRSLVDKKDQGMTTMTEEEKAIFKMPFWNQQLWLNNDYLIITEGEFDAIAVRCIGETNVVSLPNGAQSVASSFKNNFDYLQNFKTIYICFDMDDCGHKAAEDAQEILGPQKYRRILLPTKDANEWVMNDPNVTYDDLKLLMKNAEKLSLDEVVQIQSLPDGYSCERSPGISTGWRDLDDIIGGIRPGEVTVISADTGAGKTTFSINLLCNLLKEDKSGCWINSWEMDYNIIVRKIACVVLQRNLRTAAFTQFEKDSFKKWMLKNNILLNPKKSRADVQSLHKQLEFAVRVHGIKYVLLDHLDYISSASKAREGHEKVSEAVIAIHEMAMEFNVHIFLIAHPKQGDSSKESQEGKISMNSLKGSASIKQYADNIFLLQNMSQANEALRDYRLKITICKNRFYGTRGVLHLRYRPEFDTYESNNDVITTAVEALHVKFDQQEAYD